MAKRTCDRPGRVTIPSVLGLLGAAALGFWLGRGGPLSSAIAGPPAPAPGASAPSSPAPSSDYAQRVVAYIYGSVPVTREDLGEFLIARQGADKLELLVNKKIIEHACQRRGIEVTQAEVEAAIEEDLKSIPGQISRKDFVDKIVKQFGKTLYEWKEDVIKPRLMLAKLCKDRITVTDEDLQKSYQAKYGPKAECRIVLWPKGEERIALQEYEAIRKSEEEFDRKARSQANPQLAATGGRIQPIGKFCGVHPDVEKEAFALRPGEVSRLVATPEGTVLLKLDRHIPADTAVKFEEVREALHKEVYDRKVSQEAPKFILTLREEAKPVFILKRPVTAQDLEREVEKELGIQQTGATAPKK